MSQKQDILPQNPRLKDGFKFPQGYFEDFAVRMEAALPARPELESEKTHKPLTLWTRMRPYVYMAAMFLGVWAMLHLFTLITNGPANQGLSIDSHPSLAAAVGNEQFVEDYIIDDVDEYDIIDALVHDSIDVYNLTDSLYNANPDPEMSYAH